MKLFYTIVILIIAATVKVFSLWSSDVLLGDASKIHLIQMMVGKNNNLYIQTDLGIYERNGVSKIWKLVYSFNERSDFSYFFKNDSNVVHFIDNSILYRIDPATSLVSRKLYTCEGKDVIFHNGKTTVSGYMPRHRFYEYNNDNDLESMINIEHHLYENGFWIESVGFMADVGRVVTFQKDYHSDMSSIVSSKSNDEVFLGLESFKGTEGCITSIESMTNAIFKINTYDSTIDRSKSYYYDNRQHDFLNVDSVIQKYFEELKLSSSGQYYASLSRKYNGGMHTYLYFKKDFGSEWTMLEGNFDNVYKITISEDGYLYYYDTEEGLKVYDTHSDNTTSIELPNAFKVKVHTQCKDFYQLSNELWCLWKNEYILTSSDNGLLWNIVERPVNSKNAEAFYIDQNKIMYFICDSGIYSQKENEIWEHLSNINLTNYSELKIIDITMNRLLFAAKENNSTYYKTFAYSFNDNNVELTHYDHKVLEKQLNGNFLYISAADTNRLVEMDNQFSEINSTNLAELPALNKILLDSKGGIYAATNSGLYKAETWDSPFVKQDTSYAAITKMFISEDDNLYLFVIDMFGTDNNYVRHIDGDFASYQIWPEDGELAFVENSRLWNTYGKDYSPLSYAKIDDDYTPDEDFSIELTYSGGVMCVGETRDINIESIDESNYSVLVKNMVTGRDTTIYAEGNKATFVINYNEYYPSHYTFQAFAGEESSAIKEVKIGHVLYEEVNIKSYSAAYKTSNADGMASIFFYFSMEDLGLIGTGKITVTDPFTKQETIIEQTNQSDEVGYYFNVPEGTPAGLYRYYYRGVRDGGHQVATRYQYFRVIDDAETSVEEPNSIIKNAKVFPNPTANSATIDFEMEESGELGCEIYDMSGKLIQSMPTAGFYPAGQASLMIDVSNLQIGQYIIFLKSKDKATAAKVVISR